MNNSGWQMWVPGVSLQLKYSTKASGNLKLYQQVAEAAEAFDGGFRRVIRYRLICRSLKTRFH